jgi:MFS family permease
MSTNTTEQLKWREVYSLGFLNVAVAISWIAYHEYQPILMTNLGITHLVDFMLVAKAIVLIAIPPLAGLIADYILRKNGKYLIVFTVGIGATAMVFMVVASMISSAHLINVTTILPIMIVLWLISMNLFVSPANSMIEAFAPAHKLPIVMGFLFLVTELVYALEPVIVSLVVFFGDTLTFVVGGVLIAVSGFIFHRVSRDEVLQRKEQLMKNDRVPGKQSTYSYLSILVIGLFLGVGKAFIIEFIPHHIANQFPDFGEYGGYVSFATLGLCAISGFLISRKIAQLQLSRVIVWSMAVLSIGVILLLFSPSIELLIVGILITGAGFTLINISGLPFAIQNLSVRHVTYGVGIYLGASELLTGLFEYMLN